LAFNIDLQLDPYLVTLLLVDLNLPPWYQSLCKLAIELEDMHMDLEDLKLDMKLALENRLYPRKAVWIGI